MSQEIILDDPYKKLAGLTLDIQRYEIDEIDDLFAVAGLGPIDSAITSNFWGIRRNSNIAAVTPPKENQGLTFFTRPRLNLTDKNIRSSIMSVLSNKGSKSLGRAIRALLDPYSSGTPVYPTSTVSKKLGVVVEKSDLIDPLNPFITILGNSIMSSSGYPDADLNTYTSPEGVFHEQWAMVDDVVTNYSRYNLNFTFRNSYGDPVGLLIYMWLYYASSVYIGDMTPYIDSIIDNEIDYQTRIYRLVLDPTKTKVLRMFCTGAAFPTTSSVGAMFNQNEGKPFNDQIDTYSASFTCLGAIYYDPRILHWFNDTVCMFNPNMKDGVREKTYIKIPNKNMVTMDTMGYPRINPLNMDLEWWMDSSIFKLLLSRGY